VRYVQGRFQGKSHNGGCHPKPPLAIPPHRKLWGFLAFSRENARLKDELRTQLISELGKPMAPQYIYFIPDISKIRNAKVMRRILRSAYLGEVLGDISSLVNPDSLIIVEQIRAIEAE